jgi:hypothetical protein
MGTKDIDDEDYLSSLLLFDLLGKFPFTLSEQLAVYPALGITFRVAIAGNDQSDAAHKANWGLGLKGGGGVDFSLTKAIFLRGELLYYFELVADKDAKIKIADGQGGNPEYDFHFANAGYYMAPQLKVAVGYKL